MKKRILAALLLLALLLTLAGCSQKKSVPDTGEQAIEHDTKFGGAVIQIPVEELCDLGFELGDGVDILFSNGYRLENIPFYNGYYTRTGEPLLCAYPGNTYARLTFNNGEDLFALAELTEDCTVRIALHEAAAFQSIQDTMDMVYSNERSDYASDEVFANFRPMTGGELAEGLFYRGVSPCNDVYNRAAYASALCQTVGISHMLDLADDEQEIASYAADDQLDCPYWKDLYEKGAVLPLDMSANYRSETYAESVVKAMRLVIEEEGPFYIHCTEGKDRTGFVCLLVEALAGASVQQMQDDYLKTYENYYGVTEKTDPEGYEALVQVKYEDMLLWLCHTEEASSITPDQIVAGAEEYLAFGGMTGEEIRLLEQIITAK